MATDNTDNVRNSDKKKFKEESKEKSKEKFKEESKEKSTQEPGNIIRLDDTTSDPPEKSQEALDFDTSAMEQIEGLKKDLLYLRAEFENYKKQVMKERTYLIKYGGQNLVVALLDILDNFDRAFDIEINADTIESFKEGMQLTASGLKSVLKRFGIEEVNCMSQPFDPAFHEAMGSEESSTVPHGHITQVFKKTYKFHEKVIRPGQVIVAKEPQEKEPQKAEPQKKEPQKAEPQKAD